MSEFEFTSRGTQSKIVPCERDAGVKRRVYMIAQERLNDGSYLYQPNGCEEMDGSTACQQCLRLMDAAYKDYVRRKTGTAPQ